jgi:hypothetical protein
VDPRSREAIRTTGTELVFGAASRWTSVQVVPVDELDLAAARARSSAAAGFNVPKAATGRDGSVSSLLLPLGKDAPVRSGGWVSGRFRSLQLRCRAPAVA